MFIVDKDFTQLASIRKNFPDAIILPCQFHALKFMKILIASATVEKKNELKKLFKNAVYAHSEDTFNEVSKKFNEACEVDEIKVRVQDT